MKENGLFAEDMESSLREAVNEGTYRFIFKNGICIGFFTWHLEHGKVLVNNLFIEKKHRCKDSLLPLRGYLRNKYPGMKGFWHNERRNSLKIRG